MIAMAMIFTPDLVIMDEPTSALDVVAQRSLMVQIKELQRELGFAVVFVTHDMSLVSHFSDRLIVMYAGQVAESGPTRERVRPAAAPLQPGPARRVPVGARPAARAARHSRQPAGPRQAADRLPVPSALQPGASSRCSTDRAGALHAATSTDVRCLRYDPVAEAACLTPCSQPRAAALQPLLETEGLSRHFKIGGAWSRKTLHAVDDVNLRIGRQRDRRAGRRERQRQEHDRPAARDGASPDQRARSGSRAGSLDTLRGRDEVLAYRRAVPMVFQDPFSSLNPSYPVSHGMLRTLLLHRPELSREQRRTEAAAVLEQVGLVPGRGRARPLSARAQRRPAPAGRLRAGARDAARS